MGKIEEQLKWYAEGLARARDLVEEAVEAGGDPVKRLDEEIKFRQRVPSIPPMTKAQRKKAFGEIQMFTIDSMLLAAMATLHQNEDWGADKLGEFAETINTYATAIVEGSIDWDGIEEMLASIGVEVKFS